MVVSVGREDDLDPRLCFPQSYVHYFQIPPDWDVDLRRGFLWLDRVPEPSRFQLRKAYTNVFASLRHRHHKVRDKSSTKPSFSGKRGIGTTTPSQRLHHPKSTPLNDRETSRRIKVVGSHRFAGQALDKPDHIIKTLIDSSQRTKVFVDQAVVLLKEVAQQLQGKDAATCSK
ncbi:hypothetical protein OF83DRAFT_1180065 [Amylostereum chailletii]|nr:hypothetical protein OF83DRAFT_1180065 [Amylostereum chailletii]